MCATFCENPHHRLNADVLPGDVTVLFCDADVLPDDVTVLFCDADVLQGDVTVLFCDADVLPDDVTVLFCDAEEWKLRVKKYEVINSYFLIHSS
jgi:hypothetical protein